MAGRAVMLTNIISSTLRRAVTVVHPSQRSLSDYCSIDENIFWLSQEQKQVIHLWFFHDKDFHATVLFMEVRKICIHVSS
jgi:hypothetical protein